MADKKKKKEKKKRVIKKKLTSVVDKVILPITYTQYRKKCCVGEEKENISLTNKLLMELLTSGRKIGDTNVSGVALGPTPIKPTMRDVYSQTPPPEVVKLLPKPPIPYEKQYAYKENKYLTEWERRKRQRKTPKLYKEPISETEVEGYMKAPVVSKQPVVKAPLPVVKAPLPVVKPLDETPSEAPIIIKAPLPIETPVVIKEDDKPKAIITGEKTIIKIKKPKKTIQPLPLIIEEEEPQPSVKPKKPLSKMNKTELQEEYKRVMGEEPDKRFSKKDMYEILKK